MEQQIEQGVTEFLGKWGWLLVSGVCFLLFKSSVEGLVESIKVFAGDDLNTDDVVILDGRPARVVRVGLWKTIFFVYDVGTADGKPFVKSGNKMQIQNDQLKTHAIEKPLQMLDLSQWENKDA